MMKRKNLTDRDFHLAYGFWLREFELYCPRYGILPKKQREEFRLRRATSNEQRKPRLVIDLSIGIAIRETIPVLGACMRCRGGKP
jgi:hypothetical protein